MRNAAIYLHPNGFDTSGARLLGRHSAGESFLRGFVRHADVDRYYFWNVARAAQAELDALLARIEAPTRPVRWIPFSRRAELGEAGVLNLPTPDLPMEAWLRRPYGPRTYAICGITHTTATAAVMRIVPDLLLAPTEPYDALICTSSAVRESVEHQLGLMREYLAAEFGPRRRAEPQRVTIPLGVNAADFETTPADRKAWRERLQIPEDAVVALFVGRFNVRGKMNPALMAHALERAAKRTGKTLYWVNSGWAETAAEEKTFHEETRKLCPSVEYRAVDGRPPDVRFSIWSVADFFISFSDNIQETFGLTPVEAMAAGLPCVVTDWNGYKDTVRHGRDGFRVPTLAPRPGQGGDLAHWYEAAWISYDNYVGGAAQYTAIDYAEAENVIAALVENADFRRNLGAQAKRQAREVFDWSVIIPQYQDLWAEQDARRRAAPPVREPTNNPYRPDPFALFAGYPSRHLAREDLVALAVAPDWPKVKATLDAPLAVYSRFNRATDDELRLVVDQLAARGPLTVAQLLETVPPPRRSFVERSLLWLARYDVIAIAPAPR